jgi:hypothetical protein
LHTSPPHEDRRRARDPSGAWRYPNATQPENAKVAMLQRGLLPQVRCPSEKHPHRQAQKILMPIKGLSSQNRKAAQNNAVF